MQSKRLTTEPPCITEEVFEEYLDTDDMLVEYFNEFLSLPTFAQPVKFNPEFRVFEVVNDAPQLLENQLKKILRDQTPPKPIYDVLRRAKNDGQLSKMHSTSPALNIDPNYNTMCLDRAQAIQWIKKERLPAFLESDCYFEYRLAKLVSQVEWSKTGINFIIDSDFYPWIKKRDPSSPSPEEDDTSLMMKPGQATVSQTEDLSTLAKQGELMNTTDSSMHPVASSQIQDTQCLPGQHERDDSLSKEDTLLDTVSWSKESHKQSFLSPSRPASAKASIKREISREADEASYVAIAEPPSHTQLRVYLDPKWDSIEKEEDELGSAAFQTLEEFVPASTQFVTKEPISELTHQPAADIESDVDLQKHELANNEFVSDSKGDVKKKDPEEISLSSSSESDGADIRAAWCISHGTYDTGNRREFERFKKFIKGTLGERYWWLWMDIERLKTLQVTTRQQRQLSKMKKLYLLSSGDYFLSSEVLLRLDLQHGDQWNTKHLRRIQPEVVKPLLLYWYEKLNMKGPRFCVTHSTAIDTASAKLKFWHTCQQRPKVDVDPFPQMVSLLPLTPKSGIPRIQPSLSQKSRTSSLTTLLKPATPNFSLKISLSHTLPSGQSPQRDDISRSRKRPKTVSRDMIHCLALDDTGDSKYQVHRKYTYAELLLGKSAAGSVVLGESRMESMLQSLYLENRAGYYFTHFCEKSGNKLWKNSVYFWFDLQAYHQLFYQETLHPFKICKQAQHWPGGDSRTLCNQYDPAIAESSIHRAIKVKFHNNGFLQEFEEKDGITPNVQTLLVLDSSRQRGHPDCSTEDLYLYATYIAPSASMDIGLDQSKKNMIYQKIDPAFEDLFDPAEEYILTVLLEPWMKMMEADKYTYGKVELVEETRQLDSVYFRKLQALHQESGSKKDESTAADTGLPSHLGALKEDQRFSQVPKELAGPDLSDLIHDKEMLEQFWAFLNEHSAGMDLMCWLDIEQLRKMLHKDKEKMEEKSKDIGNKYFNKNYFFGPNSPATREQQEQLMRSGGGGGQILHDQLSAAVLLEMQRCVQKRLEKQWLPLFLAEEQHREEGEKKVKDITEDLPHQKQDKTTRMWKHVDSKWVSSSSEIIAFRKALLNPVTANQFQRFVSLKGDLLVNGVLFWQEVQKYKDLCHSHCDDATVQKKITAIIDRFIRSAVPPALQIDIPTEQAKKILEHRKELGPYIFREAQMTIFALLFKFWPKYCEFQSSLDSDKVLSALERKRMQKKEGKTAQQGKEKAPTSQKTSPEAKLADLSSSALGDQTGLEWKGKAPLGGYGWQASWCYSKYIEALEQERILLKREEDLEKSSSSSLTGTSSTPFPKLENSKQSTMSSKSSVILEKRSNLPKK